MSTKGNPREPSWTDIEVGYLRDNYIQVPIAAIAEHLGRSYEAVRRKAAKLGFQRKDHGVPFTPEEDRLLLERFATSPIGEVIAMTGRHPESIRNRARILGLVNEEQVKRAEIAAGVRHDYFSRIDAPIKAYLLGLMATDGFVGSGNNSVNLNVGAKDIELVELMREEISPSSRICTYTLPPLPGYTKERKGAKLSVRSAQMKADLGSFGIVPRKTFVLRWPELLDMRFAAPFILGCFDGDGCLSQQPVVWDLYSATPDFLAAARDAIWEQTGVKARGPRWTKGHVHVIRICGLAAITVDEWLHAEVPGLARKRLPPDARAQAEKRRADGFAKAARTNSLKRFTQAQLDRVLELRAQGWTLDPIAAETGVGRSTVYRLIKRAA